MTANELEETDRAADVEKTVPYAVAALLYVSIVSVVLLEPPFDLTRGLVVADLAIAGLVVGGWGVAISRSGSGRPLLLRLLPWLWLFVLANLIGLSHAGLASWGLVEIAKNTMPWVVVAVAYGVLRSSEKLLWRAWRLWLVVALAEALYVLLAASSSGVLRFSGTFGNPNYPAHYLTLTLIAVLMIERWPLKLLVTVVVGFALLRTGSFSPFPMLAVAASVDGWSWTRRFDPGLRMACRFVLAGGAILIIVMGTSRITSTEFDLGSGADSQRLTRSSESRYEIWGRGIELWEQRPLGWGPGYVAAAARDGGDPLAGAKEVHHDFIDTLLAAGFVGVIALFMLGRQVWREAPPGGLTHVLFGAIIAAGLFRQTLNFRHVALLLAISLAVDALVRTKPDGLRHKNATTAGYV